MGTTYKSTIEVRCWKEHSCISCSSTFAYLFERKVTAQGNTAKAATENARTEAVRTMMHEVDMHPCPSCGLFQPDMVGARRKRRHWWAFWTTLVYLGVLLIVFAVHWVTADLIIWLGAGGGVLSLLLNLMIDWSNPNRDPAANRERARRVLESGRMQEGQPGNVESPPLELSSPKWSVVHRLVFVVMVAAVAAMPVAEGVRRVYDWPFNPSFHPPVAGPGDETDVYLPDWIRSVKGYWNGKVVATGSIAGGSEGGTFPVPAMTKTDNWGSSISVKSSEKSTSSQLWATLLMPDRPDLAGKTIQVKIDLAVTFPESMPGGFEERQRAVSRTTEIHLATPNAGKEYTGLWWGGYLGGGGLLLAMNLVLVGVAHALKRQAPATKVYFGNDDQGGEE